MKNEIVSSRLMGGLGNYLFQISAAYFISNRDNKTTIIDTSNYVRVHSPIESYYTNILRNVKFDINIKYKNTYSSHSQPLIFNEIPKFKGSLLLDGYFQNSKYLEPIESQIKELFSIDKITKDYLLSKYEDILQKKTCSIHIRRGDYVNKQHFHPLQSLEYYLLSIIKIGVDIHYLIFSDDIEWCKTKFEFLPKKTYITDNLDYQDLYLMSMCDNNIIANSSFSWWGAWLNENKNKIVCYPDKWFVDRGIIQPNIELKNWIRI